MRKVYLYIFIVLLVIMLTTQFSNFSIVYAAEKNVGTGESANSNTDSSLPMKFDFGSEDSLIADGYVQVTGKTIYSGETGFGLDREIDFRDREGQVNASLSDFVISGDDYIFQTNIPNGTYRVVVIAGDEIASNNSSVTVNGVHIGSISSGKGEYSEIMGYTEVTNGKMKFLISGRDKRLNAIEIHEVVSETVDGVRLTDFGSTVSLENSKILVNIDKSGVISSIFYKDGQSPNFNLVGGKNGKGYYLANYSIGGENLQSGLIDPEFEIITENSDRVEISITMKEPYYVELHFVLEKDSPGLYYYTVYKYPEQTVDDLELVQLRYAFVLGDPSFKYFVIDDDRGVQQRPKNEDLNDSIKLQDSTVLFSGKGLPEGKVYTKYQNITHLEGDNHVFMVSNGEIGVSLIQASKEYFAGGPTKQELSIHDYDDGQILLWHEHTGHYGTPSIKPEKRWEKIYGPFYLYLNESIGSNPIDNVWEMWEDAKNQSRKEQSKWPYQWITNPIYAADKRVNVSGKLKITDDSSPENAWVILSSPGVDWQEETEGYVYSIRADKEGNFTIPAVRPGSYTLTAFVEGVMGEFKRENVKVDSDSTNLGTIVWTPNSHGKLLWQIGTPNRSASEFNIYGGKYGFRNHLTWLEYPYEFPNGVDFKIGESDVGRDWNYFQPMYQTPGTPVQLELRGTKQDKSLTEWKIRFDSDGYRDGTATLSIDLASSVFGTLEIKLNGESISSFEKIPGPPGDAGLYRQGIRGIYRSLSPIQFDASKIKEGENIITLSPYISPEAPTSDDWMLPMAAILYDVIRLEVDSEGEPYSGINLSELEKLLKEALEISNENKVYTEKSYKELQESIEKTQLLLTKIESEEMLNQLIMALKNVMNSLEKNSPTGDQDNVDGIDREGKENKDDETDSENMDDTKKDGEKKGAGERTQETQIESKESGTNSEMDNKGGKELPKTATNTFSLLLGGIILILLASIKFIFFKKKQAE